MRVSWPSSAADWEQTGAQFEQELQLAMQFQSPDVWVAQFESLNDMADSMNEMIQSVGEVVFGARKLQKPKRARSTTRESAAKRYASPLLKELRETEAVHRRDYEKRM